MDALTLARTANRAWVWVYTAGLTSVQKSLRRDEIASDSFEHAASYTAAGVDSITIGRQMTSRLLRGMGADVIWRMEAGREAERVALEGGSPPLPWLTMIFVTLVLVLGSFCSMQEPILGGFVVMMGMIAAGGAIVMWLGLYLASHRFIGPLLIAIGTIAIAWSLWWTFLAPAAAVVAGFAGVRRAQRFESLLSAR